MVASSGAAKGEGFVFVIVLSPQQATPMSQNNACEAMTGANRDYSEYSWEVESGFKSGDFVVHGHTK